MRWRRSKCGEGAAHGEASTGTDGPFSPGENGSVAMEETPRLELLSDEDRAALLQVVWPSTEQGRAAAISAWFQQGAGELEYGSRVRALWSGAAEEPSLVASLPLLLQRINGPCGLLAVVQAELVSRLLESSAWPPSDHASREAQARDAWIASVVAILLRAELVARSFGGGGLVVIAFDADAAGSRVLVSRVPPEETAIRTAVTSAGIALSAPPGAVLLLYSLALTAGVKVVRSAIAGEGAALGVPPADSLVVSSERQVGGFCEAALVSLAACGHAINAFNDSAWSVVKKDEPPAVGLFTGEDEALGEDVVAAWLRRPKRLAWVVLSGGHYTTLCCCDPRSTASGSDGLASVPGSAASFVFIDGLARTLTWCNVLLGDYEELPESEAALLAMRAVEIVQQRANGDYYVVCDAQGSLEGGARPREADTKWYCRDCYLGMPRVFAFNDPLSSECKECGKRDVDCGYGHWLPASSVPPALLSEYERGRAPWQLRALRTHWPRAMRLVTKATS